MRVGGAGVGARQKVMLLDDDEDMLDLLKLTLESRGLLAWGFTDPGEFFEALTCTHPALVITDLHIDAFDGMEVCRRLAQEFPQVALVVLSGDGDKHQSALQVGAHLFLTKPIGAQALGDAVVSLLSLGSGIPGIQGGQA